MKQKKKTLLWQVVPPNSSNSSYVFGTMHIRHRSVFENLDPVLEKIRACKTFATEFDLDAGKQEMKPDFGQIPNGKTLRDYLSPKKYAKLHKVLLKAFGVNLHFFQNIQPIFITSMISERVLKPEMPDSLDSHLYKYAKSEGKELTGIETFAEQFQTLEKLDIEHQLKELLKIAKNVSGYRKSVNKMIQLYLEGNPVKLFKAAKKGTGDKRKMMLYHRNEIMAGRIKDISSGNTLFAAIGAAHLAGEKGVLRLLKKEGYQVSSVN